MNVKTIAIKALQCPVRRALEQCWEKSRPHAVLRYGNTIRYDPDGALDAMRENLGQLSRLGIITDWQVETLEKWLSTDWALRVKVQYRTPAGIAMTAMDFRLW